MQTLYKTLHEHLGKGPDTFSSFFLIFPFFFLKKKQLYYTIKYDLKKKKTVWGQINRTKKIATISKINWQNSNKKN